MMFVICHIILGKMLGCGKWKGDLCKFLEVSYGKEGKCKRCLKRDMNTLPTLPYLTLPYLTLTNYETGKTPTNMVTDLDLTTSRYFTLLYSLFHNNLSYA